MIDNIYVRSKIDNILLEKCKISGLCLNSSTDTITTTTLIHCKVTKSIRTSGQIICVNSVISNPNCYDIMEATNCYITSNATRVNTNDIKENIFSSTEHAGFAYAGGALSRKTFINCIVRVADDLQNSCFLQNCVVSPTGSGVDPLRFLEEKASNTVISNDAKIFKNDTELSIFISNEATYELTDEAKAKYLGIDGTQVGIYGGNIPFDTTPSNPQIVKCNVASKSTADGKLSVDIEVKAAE